MKDQITAEEWFSSGTRVIYDPVTRKIVERAGNADVHHRLLHLPPWAAEQPAGLRVGRLVRGLCGTGDHRGRVSR